MTSSSSSNSDVASASDLASNVNVNVNVQTFVRVRPLLPNYGDADERGVEYDASSVRVANQKRFDNFTSVFGENDTNEIVADAVLVPLVDAAVRSSAGTLFAYGFSGSGKTHSLFGSSSSVSPPERGLWAIAAQRLLAQATGVAAPADFADEDRLLIEARFVQLLNERVFDLFCDDASDSECTLRADADGNLLVRAATVLDPTTGRVTVAGSVAVRANTIDVLQAAVDDALRRRAVGNSTVHAASSRSHAMLELELVSQAVVAARQALLEAEGDVVPIGKALDDERIREASHSLRQTATGAWETFQPDVPFDDTDLRRLEAAKSAAVAVAGERRADLASATRRAPPGIGGVLLFADLAGAEFAATASKQPAVTILSQSAEALRQGRSINKSLLALNECIRALHARRAHVPFRNSTLTRMLKRFLTAPNAVSSVLATVSPAANHRLGTTSTLTQVCLLH